MDHGFSFHWPAWSEKPYLESPAGFPVAMMVEGKIPYLTIPRDLVEPEVTKVCPVWATLGADHVSPGEIVRWVNVDFRAHPFL
eukprot:5554755-Prorocentrum_lima.AAC.1